MNLDHLHALRTVVDAGSFEAAASRLHLTPSAISQRLKALETEVGQILVRRTKPTEPTLAGQAYLRLARQVDTLIVDAAAAAEATVTVSLAMSSDALATWALPALASVGEEITFDLHREDEGHSAELLRAGTVMAAITTDSRAVQGCTVTRLGSMRYRPMSSRGFADRWFADGVTAAALGVAPLVVFDRKDELQDRYLRSRTRSRLDPPRHHIPGSQDFARAVQLGLGWGMLPDEQSAGLVDLDPGNHIDVVLYWQQWSLRTPALDAVAAAIMAAAPDEPAQLSRPS